jgi:hypothetical protein
MAPGLDSDNGLPGRLMTGGGRSYVDARRGIGAEKADRVRGDLLGVAIERGSRGAENSCLCKAAPECKNMLQFVVGRDAPRRGAPFQHEHGEEAHSYQETGRPDGSREVVEERSSRGFGGMGAEQTKRKGCGNNARRRRTDMRDLGQRRCNLSAVDLL